MRKNLLFLLALLCPAAWLSAQSIQDARKLLYYERYDSAVNLLTNLLDREPGNAEAWWLLTDAGLHAGKEKQLRTRLATIPPTLVESPLILCVRGRLYLQENKTDSARYCFDKALGTTKEKDLLVLHAIARSQLDTKAGDPNYAIALINKALKKDKKNAEWYVLLGNSNRKLSDGTESYKAYQAALEQDPSCAEALYRLGTIFSAQENAGMYLQYYNDAVARDSLYGPAWYALYYHYYFRDVNKAKDCLERYIAVSDKNPRNDYLLTDLLYVSRQYTTAIGNARKLLADQGVSAEPRLYKLLAYCYQEQHDTATALQYMKDYFARQSDTSFVGKDFETMGDLCDAGGSQPDTIARYYKTAAEMEKDSSRRIELYKKLCDRYKSKKDYPGQAYWTGRYYQENRKATNLDLFNWGLANYMAHDYKTADSVFGIYTQKYPEQSFGYFWRARSNAAIDTAMQYGLAIPWYQKLESIDTANATDKNDRKQLIESYGYIAAYKANTQKDYAGAIVYFEKLLTLDPGNTDAKKYLEILKRNQLRRETSKTGGQQSSLQ